MAASDSSAASAEDNRLSPRRLQAASSGGGLCRPPGGATAERSPTAIPWRERPLEMATWPAKPAASAVVAHATAERVLEPCAGVVSPLETTVSSTRNLREN